MQRELWSTCMTEDQLGSTSLRLVNSTKLIKQEEDEQEDEEDDETTKEIEEIRKIPVSKRKRILTIFDKVNILYKLDEGMTPGEIARTYSVTTSAISKIKKRKIDYLSKPPNEMSLQQKNLRGTQNPAVEDMTYAWFCQKICLGEPINGPSLCEKALVLNEKINGPSTFKASNGWLHRFKRRHGIRHLSPHNDKMSSDTVPSNEFINDFKKYVEYHGYDKANIYNADETGLNWNSLPSRTLSEKRVCGLKDTKDRVTILICSNTTGTHKITALVIGKQEKFKCFGNVTCLPVIYKNQTNSLMDRSLFVDWYTNDFIPSVRQEQEKTGNRGKVLLLLDNAPCHSSVPLLNSIDEQFSVMYLPPNATSILQPMNRGIVQTMKNNYRKTLAIRLLLSNNISIDDFVDSLTIKDCCEIIACSWQNISAQSLFKSWESLLPENSKVPDDSNEFFTNHDEIVTTLNQIDNFNVTKSEILEWLNEDSGDHGWAPLTDEQLIAEAIGNETFNVGIGFKYEPHCEVVEQNDELYNARDVLDSINIVYKWYEKQRECVLDDLMILNKIRNTAMKNVLLEK